MINKGMVAAFDFNLMLSYLAILVWASPLPAHSVPPESRRALRRP